jgi:hypothetical protein
LKEYNLAKLIPEAPKLRQKVFFFLGKIKYKVKGTENIELEENRGFMTVFWGIQIQKCVLFYIPAKFKFS